MPIVGSPVTVNMVEKVLRSVVTPLDDGWNIWDPMTGSEHIFNLGCDCVGYSIRGICSHQLAVDMHKKRLQGYSPEQVKELLQNL